MIFNTTVPLQEQKENWHLLLTPLIEARLKRPNPEKSRLLLVLNGQSNFRTWKDVKFAIEIALKYCTHASSIMSRTASIKTSPNPDQIIDEMFAELRAVEYLFHKGAKNIRYNKKGIDFTAEFGEQTYGIEVTYVNGPDFKFQKPVLKTTGIANPVYLLKPDALINKFNSCYKIKEKQLIKHNFNQTNSIIIIVTDLLEVYEPWLDRRNLGFEHPINEFVLTTKIPTVIYSATIYESEHGILKFLPQVDWIAFQKIRASKSL